jgi:hypothetical protein
MTTRLFSALLCGAVFILSISTDLSLAQDAGAKRYGGMQFGGGATSLRSKSTIGHESTHVIQQGKGRQKKPVGISGSGHGMSKSIIQNIR